MAIKILREPSETPNINNTDDFVSIRYAYGNQDGYIPGKGEISLYMDETHSKIFIPSGRLVVQGVEVDIDADGVELGFTDVPMGTVYATVYCRVNLATNTTSIETTYDIMDYPEVDKGDDLTEVLNGVANLVIGNVKLENQTIIGILTKIKKIEYTTDMTVKNAMAVNNLEIKRDENGVLKIGDTIIPQKKLIWMGSIQIGHDQMGEGTWSDFVDILNIEINKRRRFEIHLLNEYSVYTGFRLILDLLIDKDSTGKYMGGILYQWNYSRLGDATGGINSIEIRYDSNTNKIRGYSMNNPLKNTFSGGKAASMLVKAIYEIIE